MNWRVKIIGGENDGKEFIVLNSSYENAIDEVFEDNDLSLFNNSYERLEVTRIDCSQTVAEIESLKAQCSAKGGKL